MEMRHRSGSIDYSNDSRTDTVFTVDNIEYASKWGDSTVKPLNILVKDVSEMFSECNLNDKAVQLTIPEWKNGNWLFAEDISSMKHDNRVICLIAKIREVYIASTTISHHIFDVMLYVDGFMNTLL
jgi:phenylpyruvate tautomerase PptA (4-oxalocrotonate tautomerase family)